MKITGKHFAAIGAAAVIAAAPFVAQFEGFGGHAYRDVIGVATYCYGDTKNVDWTKTYSKAQCQALLSKRLQNDYADPINACLDLKHALPVKVGMAMLDLGYNIGVGGFCHSTVASDIKAGNLTAACNGLPAYIHAGGRVLPGLVIRRGEEKALCLAGVAEGV